MVPALTGDTLNSAAISQDEVSVLVRCVVVLAVIAIAPRSMSNRKLAVTLVSAGCLRQQADSERFTLGAGVMELGRAELRKFDLRSHARLHLAAVAEFAGAAVHMDAREGLDIVFIDAIWALSAVILSNLDVGLRLAISSSALGHVYTAALDAYARADLLIEHVMRERIAPCFVEVARTISKEPGRA